MTPPHRCPIRNCGGTLRVDETLTQDDTGSVGQKVRCDKKPGHRFFLIDGRAPSTHNQLIDDTRWKRREYP